MPLLWLVFHIKIYFYYYKVQPKELCCIIDLIGIIKDEFIFYIHELDLWIKNLRTKVACHSPFWIFIEKSWSFWICKRYLKGFQGSEHSHEGYLGDYVVCGEEGDSNAGSNKDGVRTANDVYLCWGMTTKLESRKQIGSSHIFNELKLKPNTLVNQRTEVTHFNESQSRRESGVRSFRKSQRYKNVDAES